MVPCFRTIRHDTAEQYLHNTADEEKTAWHNYDKPRPFWYDDARTWGRTCIVVRGSKAAHFFLGNPGNPREIATIRTVLQFCSFKIQQLLQTFVCFDQCCRRVLVKCSECVDFFFISLWMCKMSKNLGSLDDEQTLSASFSRFIQNDGCDGSSQSKFVERCQSRVSGALCG